MLFEEVISTMDTKNVASDKDKAPTESTHLTEDSGDNDATCCCVCIPKRYVVAIMQSLLSLFVAASSTALPLGIDDLTTNETTIVNQTVYINGSYVQAQEMVIGDPRLRWYIMAAYQWGYLAALIPGGILTRQFGGTIFQGVGALLVGIYSVITPVVGSFSPWSLIGIRILYGISMGFIIPSQFVLLSNWSPPDERGILFAITYVGMPLGKLVSMLMSSCDVLTVIAGWQSIFYIFGGLTILFVPLWFLIVREDPTEHATISKAELEHLAKHIWIKSFKQGNTIIPWKVLFTDMRVWALYLTASIDAWGIFSNEGVGTLDTFYRNIFGVNNKLASILSYFPAVWTVVSIHISGFVSYALIKKEILSITTVRKVFTCFGFITMGLLMILVGVFITLDLFSFSILATAGFGFNGFAVGGFMVNALDIAPQYSGIVIAAANAIATVTKIVVDVFEEMLTQYRDRWDWSIVFYVLAAFYLLGAVYYSFFADGDIQEWALSESDTTPIIPAAEQEEEDGDTDQKSVALKHDP